jgi:hypothetical protein
VVQTGRCGIIGVVWFGLQQEGTLAFGTRAVVDGHAEEPGSQIGQPIAVVRRVEQIGGYRRVHHQSGDIDAERQ